MPYALLALAFVLNASANILLKVAAANGFSFGEFLRGHFTQAHLIAALAVALFAGNLAAYLAALARIPLSVGYPIMVGMTFIIITCFALWSGERINTLEITGLAAILGGIALVLYATA